MSEAPTRLVSVLTDRYRIEPELGQGGMATLSAAESRGSDVAEATGWPLQPGMAPSSGSASALAPFMPVLTGLKWCTGSVPSH